MWQDHEPGDQSNPHDSFGSDHNKTLDHIQSRLLSYPISDRNNIGVLSLLITDVVSYLFELNGGNDIKIRNEIFKSCSLSACRIINRSGNLFNQYDYCSNTFCTFMNSLFGTISKTNQNNIIDSLREIRTLESTIPSLSFPENEERMAYWMGSISRYSLAYWIHEFSLTTSRTIDSLWIASKAKMAGWNWTPEEPPIQKAGNPPSWVYADIDGAFVGALFYWKSICCTGRRSAVISI